MRLLHSSLIHSLIQSFSYSTNKHIISTFYVSGILAYPGNEFEIMEFKFPQKDHRKQLSKMLFPIPVIEKKNLYMREEGLYMVK